MTPESEHLRLVYLEVFPVLKAGRFRGGELTEGKGRRVSEYALPQTALICLLFRYYYQSSIRLRNAHQCSQ